MRVVTTSGAHVDRFHVRVDHGRALLTLVVSGTPTTRVGTLTLGVPRGAKATDLVVTIGESRSIATFVERTQAHEQFSSIVQAKHDPALLEQLTSDTLRLHVFPLAKGKPATVEIAIDNTAAASARSVTSRLLRYVRSDNNAQPMKIERIARKPMGPNSPAVARTCDSTPPSKPM